VASVGNTSCPNSPSEGDDTSPHEEALKTAQPTHGYVFYYSSNNSAKQSQTECLLMSNLFFFKRGTLRGAEEEGERILSRLHTPGRARGRAQSHSPEIRPEPKSRVRCLTD